MEAHDIFGTHGLTGSRFTGDHNRLILSIAKHVTVKKCYFATRESSDQPGKYTTSRAEAISETEEQILATNPGPDLSSDDIRSVIEHNLDILAETGGVVVASGFGVTERFHDRVGS
jgi:hypothetical protein